MSKWGDEDDPITAEQIEVLRELLGDELSEVALRGFLIVSPRLVDEFGAHRTQELQSVFRTETAQAEDLCVSVWKLYSHQLAVLKISKRGIR